MNERQRRDGATGDFSQKASEDAASLRDKANTEFDELAEPMKDKARAAADEQKAVGADQISGLGRAMHGAADELGKEIPQAAGYVHSAAESLQDAASALRNRSIEDLLKDFSAFARKQPAAAFAGSVLAGFAVSRFLKSSRVQSRDQA